jgi:hypothetical protein
VLQSSSSWTVLRNHHHNHQESPLFIFGSSMVNWNFFHLDRVWANLTSPITFLKLHLHLFLAIGSKSLKNNFCHHNKVRIRNSPLL